MTLWTKVKQHPRLGLILLAFIALIALGLPDGLLGVGWPSIRAGFSMPLDAIGMFLVASVAGYMTSSFLSGFLLARVGVGRLLAGSCFLTGLALIGYTLVPQWGMMVALDVLARHISLEVIPVCLLAVYAALLGAYLLALRPLALRPQR